MMFLQRRQSIENNIKLFITAPPVKYGKFFSTFFSYNKLTIFKFNSQKTYTVGKQLPFIIKKKKNVEC